MISSSFARAVSEGPLQRVGGFPYSISTYNEFVLNVVGFCLLWTGGELMRSLLEGRNADIPSKWLTSCPCGQKLLLHFMIMKPKTSSRWSRCLKPPSHLISSPAYSPCYLFHCVRARMCIVVAHSLSREGFGSSVSRLFTSTDRQTPL